jgi:hypothetical protein
VRATSVRQRSRRQWPREHTRREDGRRVSIGTKNRGVFRLNIAKSILITRTATKVLTCDCSSQQAQGKKVCHFAVVLCALDCSRNRRSTGLLIVVPASHGSRCHRPECGTPVKLLGDVLPKGTKCDDGMPESARSPHLGMSQALNKTNAGKNRHPDCGTVRSRFPKRCRSAGDVHREHQQSPLVWGVGERAGKSTNHGAGPVYEVDGNLGTDQGKVRTDHSSSAEVHPGLPSKPFSEGDRRCHARMWMWGWRRFPCCTTPRGSDFLRNSRIGGPGRQNFGFDQADVGMESLYSKTKVLMA